MGLRRNNGNRTRLDEMMGIAGASKHLRVESLDAYTRRVESR